MIINKENLRKEDLNSYYHKVRAIMKDKDNKYFITDMNGSYNLPGGRVKEGEDLKFALIRELKEEMGIDAVLDEIDYIGNFKFYHKKFPYNTNRENEIDLFYVNVPVRCLKNEMQLTSYEIKNNFKMLRVSEEEIEELINKEIKTNPYKKFNDVELKTLFKFYKKKEGKIC